MRLSSWHTITSGIRLLPDDPAVGCEDTFDEWGTIMSAKCTGCMDLVTQTRQENLARSKGNFLPVQQSNEWCDVAGHVHLTILEINLIDDGDCLGRHHTFCNCCECEFKGRQGSSRADNESDR
jgi:hypothetical protein